MSAEGAIARAEAGVLNDAEEMRTLADYAEQFVLTEEDARTTLRDAEAFVERTSELLHDESQAPVTSNL
jgi:uncharacterized protein (UPF0332 family)